MAYIPQAPGSYQGNQVLINSDRLIFNAKEDSILLFSDKAIGFSTNGSFHFDTSSDENESKFVVNSPNIYLGLEFNNTLPEQPAVLGDELIVSLTEILELITKIYQDLSFNVTFISTTPGTPTGLNPTNYNIMQKRMKEIQNVRDSFEAFKSQNTKLV
tara:strand:+ start:845 stop:1318 length:474 start_codon:yes stop_codon:yes gene_type:complete